MNLLKFYNSIFEPGVGAPAETVNRIIKQPFFGRSKSLSSQYIHSHYYTAIGHPKFVAECVMSAAVESARVFERYVK